MEKEKGRAIPSRFVVPANLPTHRVTRYVIQRGPFGEFVLSMFELRPPVILGDPEQRREQVEKIEYLDEVCVGRFVLPEGRLVELQELLARYVQEHGLKRGDDDNIELIG